MIFPDEEWVQICKLDSENEICFTEEYLEITKELMWGARKFAAHLITYWDLEHQNILDYFGSDDDEEDKYSGINGQPMNVREDVTDLLSYYDKPYSGLDGEWYRDILRAKLITLKLPKRLIAEYVKVAKAATLKG